MREIRPLAPGDWPAFVEIVAEAYPGVGVSDAAGRERLRQRAERMHADPEITFYGLHDGRQLLGVMRLHDFRMQLLSTRTLVGGLGGLAVALTHKKEKIAYDMVQFFLRHYRAREACLTTLYPFRPDFYRRMGFGYGTKMSQYRLRPADLPAGGDKGTVAMLAAGDEKALNGCYERVLARSNGLISHSAYVLETMLSSRSDTYIGAWEGDQLRGYLAFEFKSGAGGHFLSNDMHVHELVYETPAALHALLAFLRSQADQVETVVINTQDEDFHQLLPDPRNGSGRLLPPVYHESNSQGVGIMYRLIDIPRLFTVLQRHHFGGQSGRLKLTITDTFLAENAGSWVVAFANGHSRLAETADYDVEVTMEVGHFSSLVLGATHFKQLYAYGLAAVSDERYVDTVHQLFYTDNKPRCLTYF